MPAWRACWTLLMALGWKTRLRPLSRKGLELRSDVVLMSPCNCEFCFHGIDHRETKWCFPVGALMWVFTRAAS